MRKIMIVEDDEALNRGIELAIKQQDDCILQAYCLTKANELLRDNPDLQLIILDENLPDGNGLDLLKELRKTSEMPVIILTANDLETDVVTGLELGADDYITKPFSLMILRARVNARFRNLEAKGSNKSGDYEIDDWSFSFDRMEFRKGNELVELSKNEQRLLRLFVENPHITLRRGDLVDRLWTDGAEYVDENALSVVVKRLRNKLEEDATHPKYIQTVYGIGYRWGDKK
ncbi:two-component response regulator [Lachnospiraceae bacterium KM106-2]|nr:two-component response regulator [Lachnospiraceae bacterium KM106-2]